MASLAGFNGVVALSCTPSSNKISCSVDPSTPTLNGQVTATLTVSAPARASALVPPSGPVPSGWLRVQATLVFAGFLAGTLVHRKFSQRMALGFGCVAILLVASCGSGGGSSKTGPPPPPPPAQSTAGITYTVVVSGTANGIIHNTNVIVVVQ
jgi:hypothetical protein